MYKQIIKNSSIITLIFIGFISCEKEYDIPESNNFSDAVAVASGNTRIQKGGLTSFADLSRGVTKRTWTIPESAYISNLDGKQPGDLDLIHVVFEEAGDYNVNLKAEFEVDSVALDTTFSVKVLEAKFSETSHQRRGICTSNQPINTRISNQMCNFHVSQNSSSYFVSCFSYFSKLFLIFGFLFFDGYDMMI